MSETPIKIKISALLARLVVGGVFVYAGAVKALAPAEEFAYAIETYKVVGPKLALLAANVMPWVEVYAGLLLAAGVFTAPLALFNLAMLAFFELLLGQAWLRGLPITSCGCFGAGGSTSISQEFLQNLCLMCLAWVAFKFGRHWSVDQACAPAPEAGDAA
ncbi:MAG: DoxX family membrane protein [Elusimicrobia bacterium]|nr:DoxX family membrane protein [Elusimicrobiota bacterium]